MSTEYIVAAEASWGSADRAAVQTAFALVKARAAPYQFEAAFEPFGAEAEQWLSTILDDHSHLFRSLQTFTDTAQGVSLRWSGYGSGELFLGRVLFLLRAMGLADVQGQAVGDEGADHCKVVGDGLHCECIDVEP